MRSFQIVASLPPERACAVLRSLSEKVPVVFAQALGAACIALRTRPVYFQRQPFEKRAEAIRRALSRVAADPVAAEVLAAYFLECRKPRIVGWREAVGSEDAGGR